jgi:hypothetical protein
VLAALLVAFSGGVPLCVARLLNWKQDLQKK